MKTYALCLITLILVGSRADAEIKNGYGIEINNARKSLKGLHALLTTDDFLSGPKRKLLKNRIKKVEAFIANYECTSRLLAEFRSISPALYDEINFIKDHEGRPVDVYVKLVDEEEFRKPLKATTNVEQANGDKNAYYSEYGFNTVSVRIAIGLRSLWILAHEFGHIYFLVPNLATYIKYINHYKKIDADARVMGHHQNDPSGQMAEKYEVRFSHCYHRFLKSANDRRKSQRTVT